MELFDRISAWFEDRPVSPPPPASIETTDINPATGLPTVAGVGSPDVARNPYGVDLHRHDHDLDRYDCWSSSFDDNFHRHDNGFSSHSYNRGHDPWRE